LLNFSIFFFGSRLCLLLIWTGRGFSHLYI
jgi:hypothetical protein